MPANFAVSLRPCWCSSPTCPSNPNSSPVVWRWQSNQYICVIHANPEYLKMIKMKLERTLFQKSYLFFIGFLLFVIAAFWLTYFTRILDQENYRMHTHGISLLLWCLMLVTQSLLVRNNQNQLHKRIGKFSYVVVPLVIFTTIDLLHYRVRDVPVPRSMDLFFIALVLNALVAFVIFYGLAILNKKKSAIHGRYMLCTIFPFFTPATDRIQHIYFPSTVQYLPTIDGSPIAPVVGFFLADMILFGLAVWDWRSHRRWNVFPSALVVMLIYQYSVLNFYKFEFWKSFGVWFIGR